MGIVAFRTAKHEVYRYRLELKRYKKRARSVAKGHAKDDLPDHREVVEQRECEDCLQLGIDAFGWLQKARQSYQEDVYSGQSVFDDETERQITDLYEGWLKPCTAAERWIEELEHHRCSPQNNVEFRRCCSEAAAILEERQLVAAARRARLQSADEN